MCVCIYTKIFSRSRPVSHLFCVLGFILSKRLLDCVCRVQGQACHTKAVDCLLKDKETLMGFHPATKQYKHVIRTYQ